MRKLTLPLVAAALLFTASCNNTPEGDKAEAGEAITTTTPAAGADYKVDVAASKIEWVGSKPVGDNHKGTINLKEGTLKAEQGKLTGGSFVIDMTTITPTDQDAEGNTKLKGHLSTGDFFTVDSFPIAKFEIVSVADGADTAKVQYKEATHTVTGNLTIKGITKSITFPAHIEATDAKVTAHAVFNIDRSQWGITYANSGVKDKVINNDINLTIHVEANK